MADEVAAEPGTTPDWTFDSEGELLAGAGVLDYVAGPLRLASHALCMAIEAAQAKVASSPDTASEVTSAGIVLALSFRATRAVAVLVAGGLASEAQGQIRRLTEFAVLAEHLRQPGQRDYAARWLEGQTTPSKLFKGDVARKTNKYLSQSAHADALHLRDLASVDGRLTAWPARDQIRDVAVPWAATCLTRDILLSCEAVLGFAGPGARVAEEIDAAAGGVAKILGGAA